MKTDKEGRVRNGEVDVTYYMVQAQWTEPSNERDKHDWFTHTDMSCIEVQKALPYRRLKDRLPDIPSTSGRLWQRHGIHGVYSLPRAMKWYAAVMKGRAREHKEALAANESFLPYRLRIVKIRQVITSDSITSEGDCPQGNKRIQRKY
jgi:hypothetical protein